MFRNLMQKSNSVVKTVLQSKSCRPIKSRPASPRHRSSNCCSSCPRIAPADLSKLFIAAEATLVIKHNVERLDALLEEACEDGDVAIVDLMFCLKEQIIKTCHEYMNCLKRQIEIIDQASRQGPLSDKWDDLSEWRVKAAELGDDLNTLVAFLRTVGNLMKNDAPEVFTQQREYIQLINDKIQEVEEFLVEELAEIKKTEAALLEMNKESISRMKYQR